MGNDGDGLEEGLASPLRIKVHVRMCSELHKLVIRVSDIIPEIEAARPRASGITALCSLNDAIARSKTLLRHCRDSSKLYLVLIGDSILERCNQSRNRLEHNLGVIQTMVPVTLSNKISGIIIPALRSTDFSLDPLEENSGKILHELLKTYSSTLDSRDESALSSIHSVCSHLHISSQKALLIEKRSIIKQLNKLSEHERPKKKILSLFHDLLSKYAKVITRDEEDHTTVSSESWRSSTDHSFAHSESSMSNPSLPLDYSFLPVGSLKDSDKEVCPPPPDSSSDDVVEDIKRLLKISSESWSMMPFDKFVQLLVRFLKDARDLHDIESLRTGCLHLLGLVKKHRKSISYMKEDAYTLLGSLIDTEVIREALSIFEALSFHDHVGYKIAESGAVFTILNILSTQVDQELVKEALNILHNMSIRSDDICDLVVPSELIRKVMPLLEDSTHARHCVTILNNLCDNIKVRVSIAETDGCVSAIVKLLENGSCDEQENAVAILFSLCNDQRVRYHHLVNEEEVISGVVYVSMNGSRRAKAMAMELSRVLSDGWKWNGTN